VCYYLGDGLPHLQSEGEAWLKKAAEQGYEPAIQVLIDISAEH
jgi:TPR repeat protein